MGCYRLRVGFRTAIKDYSLGDNNKKTVNLWVNTIYKAITGQESPDVNDAPDGLLSGVNTIAGAIKGTVDVFKKSFGSVVQQAIEQVSYNCPSCGHKVAGFKGQKIRCPYCGNEHVVE